MNQLVKQSAIGVLRRALVLFASVAFCLSALAQPTPVSFLLSGPGNGGGPHIRLKGGNPPGANLASGFDLSFFSFTSVPNLDPMFRGGARVALCHITGRPVPDVVTIPGRGGGPRLQIYKGTNSAAVAPTLMLNAFVYEDTFRGGGWVACGDFDGDGYDDLVTGAGAVGDPAGSNGGSRVRVLSGRILTDLSNQANNPLLSGSILPAHVNNGVTIPAHPAQAAVMADFFAYDGTPVNSGGRFGVTVAVGDVNKDGVLDLITGTDLRGGPRVRVFNGNLIKNGQVMGQVNPVTGQVDYETRFPPSIVDFFAFHHQLRTGVFVAAGDVNGDGYADIVTGAPSSTFGSGANIIGSPTAPNYNNVQFRSEGLVRVFDGKWFAENVTPTAANPCITFSGNLSSATVPSYTISNPQCLVAQFMGFESTFYGPIYVSSADMDGDGKAEVAIGAGETGGPRVTIFKGAVLMQRVLNNGNNPALSSRPPTWLDNQTDLFMYSPGFRGGAHPAIGVERGFLGLKGY